MAIPAHGEHYRERRRSALTRLFLAHERLAIGGGTLAVLLLVWEAVGRSGLVDPLFLPSPTQIAQAGWGLSRDGDFWNDLQVSGREFILGYGALPAMTLRERTTEIGGVIPRHVLYRTLWAACEMARIPTHDCLELRLCNLLCAHLERP